MIYIKSMLVVINVSAKKCKQIFENSKTLVIAAIFPKTYFILTRFYLLVAN